MAMQERQQQDQGSEDQTLIDQQAPSYSSSYNESTPGEIIERRSASLHDEATPDDQTSGSAMDDQAQDW